jgi:pimeloyl-ACP methyl ester carboxylesterase
MIFGIFFLVGISAILARKIEFIQAKITNSFFLKTNFLFSSHKDPMVKRIHELREDIPISFIYGSRSWVSNESGETIKALRPKSFVNIEMINQAGHHVYADKPEDFNQLVLKACEYQGKVNVKEEDQESPSKLVFGF